MSLSSQGVFTDDFRKYVVKNGEFEGGGEEKRVGRDVMGNAGGKINWPDLTPEAKIVKEDAIKKAGLNGKWGGEERR